MRIRLTVLAAASIVAVSATAACSSSTSSDASGSGAASSASASDRALLPASLKNSGAITFALQQHPPFTIITGSTPSGPAVDLENAIAAKLGLKVKTAVVAGGLTSVLSGELSGRYDAFNGPVEASADREKQYDIVSYMTQFSAYVVTQERAKKSNVDQLCGQTVAYVTSTVQQAYDSLASFCQSANKPAPKLLNVDNNNDTILAVKSGRAYAAGISSAAAEDVVHHDHTLGMIHQTSAQGLVTTKYGIVIPKSLGLGKATLAALKDLFAEGKAKSILQKYGLEAGLAKAPQLNPSATVEG